MHYTIYPYAMSMHDQAAMSDVTTMTILLVIVLIISVYIINKITK